MDAPPEEPVDPNSRGLGLALRVLGVVFPLAVFFAVFLSMGNWYQGGVSHDPWAGVFKVIAYLWAWPYGMYDQEPMAFGLFALAGIAVSAILFLRRDWKGAVSVLLWSLFWGWFLGTLMGQD